MTWIKERAPAPRALLAAPRPLSVPRPCQEALAHPVQTGLFTGEPQTRGKEVSPSQHGQPLAWAVSPRAGLGAVPTMPPLAPAEGRVTLQVLFPEFGGSHGSLAARTVQRGGDLLVASCPGSGLGQRPVPAGGAQLRRVSVLPLVVLALQGTERGAG